MVVKILAGVVTLGIIVGAVFWWEGKDTTKLTDDELVATACIQHTNLALHIHPTLEIIIKGEKQPIPANVGVSPACMRVVHTHDDTGKIHIETPEVRELVLGHFFTVWGKTFTKDQILDAKADAEHPITVTVNGKAVDTYEKTPLKDLDAIVISIP